MQHPHIPLAIRRVPWPKLLPILGGCVFLAALAVLYHELRAFHFHQVRAYLHALPSPRLWAALGVTFASYTALVVYDLLAFRYVEKVLPLGKIALASFISNAFTVNVGNSVLSGGSVRLRLHSAWGVPAGDIGRIMFFCLLATWQGWCLLAGVLFTLAPFPLPASIHLPVASLRILGILLLMGAFTVLGASWGRRRIVLFSRWPLALPSPALTAAVSVIAAGDWALSAATLYVLLPPQTSLSLVPMTGIFLLAQVVGVASQVPGGLGVFESAFLLLLPASIPRSSALGALLAFRGIYYLSPLALAALLLGGEEALQHRRALRKSAAWAMRWSRLLVPQVLSVVIFVGGAILLFSGATPAVTPRLGWVNRTLPLGVIELSHFLGSLTGVGLLVLARGIQRRVDGAYFLTLVLLTLGVVFSLLKGFDYEEAITLSLIFMALLPCRREFTRKASLFQQRFSAPWWGAVLVVVLCTLWLGLFSYKHVLYSQELWWRFSLHSDASRFLRGTVGVTTVLLFLGVAQLLRPGAPRPQLPNAATLERVAAVVRACPRSEANLALLGDKQFLLNSAGDAFLMYAVEGRSWVVLNDPVGPEESWEELLWQFRELCDDHGGWPVFYQVGEANLSYYVDLGLSVFKLGEVGTLPLESFSLEGGARKNFRQNKSRLERDGLRFRVIPREQVPAHLSTLREVSDGWLEGKHVREKGFSLGRFQEDYLCRFPCAVVEQDGRIIAFANVWTGADKSELSPDLMRYRPDAPSGVMEFLFVEMMLWAKAEGYRRFNLGMAPLARLENRPLAPHWNRIGAAVFRYGEHFYNFQGIRHYKEKFAPDWAACYIVCPGGWALPGILLNISTLISGGLAGVVRR